MEPLTAVAELLPAHLGWDNANFIPHLHGRVSAPDAPTPTIKVEEGLPVPETTTAVKPVVPSINIFGHLLDRLQQRGQVGEGRVWLLLRFLDRQNGEGRVSVKLARHMLTSKRGSYRCLSWKRLRQILNQGEGVFWHRDEAGAHIYYHAEARVAQAVGVTQMRGWGVKIPVRDLCQPIKKVRALFYDAFHSARGDGFQEPITRRILHERGNGDARTQRTYEAVRGVERQAQYASLGQYNVLAWRQAQAEDSDGSGERIGGPAFIFVDYKGLLGKNPHRLKRPVHQQHWHNVYIMRQIGNAYRGTLPTVKRGRKWTNQKLKHLCNSIHPTGSFAAEDESAVAKRMYYETQDTAVRALQRDRDEAQAMPNYWAQTRGETPTQSGYWGEEVKPESK